MTKAATVLLPTPCQCGAVGFARHTGPVEGTDLNSSRIEFRCGRVHILHWRTIENDSELDVQFCKDTKPCPNKLNNSQ